MKSYISKRPVAVEKIVTEIVEQEVVVLEMSKLDAGKLRYFMGMNITIPEAVSRGAYGSYVTKENTTKFMEEVRGALNGIDTKFFGETR